MTPSGGCGSAVGAESRGGAETWALAGPPPPSGGGVPVAHSLPASFRRTQRTRRRCDSVGVGGRDGSRRQGRRRAGRERRRRADEEGFRGGESQRGGGTNRFRRRRCRPREGADGSRRPGGGAAGGGWGVPRRSGAGHPTEGGNGSHCNAIRHLKISTLVIKNMSLLQHCNILI